MGYGQKLKRILDEKDMSADAEFYRDIDCVDPVSGKFKGIQILDMILHYALRTH